MMHWMNWVLFCACGKRTEKRGESNAPGLKQVRTVKDEEREHRSRLLFSKKFYHGSLHTLTTLQPIRSKDKPIR